MIFLGSCWRISFRAGQSFKTFSVSNSSCSHSQLLVLKTCSGKLVFPSQSFVVFSATVTCSRVGQALGFWKVPRDTLDCNRFCKRCLPELNQRSVLAFEAALLLTAFVALSCHFLCGTKHQTIRTTLQQKKRELLQEVLHAVFVSSSND